MAGAKCSSMKTLASLALVAALIQSPSASAQDAQGRVLGIYREAAPGVLVDASMLAPRQATRWLDVELDGDQPTRKHAWVMLPDGMRASIGDRVALRLGEPKSNELAAILPPLAVNRAFAISPAASELAERASSGASRAAR